VTPTDAEPSFGDALDELEGQGCALLVAGSVPDEIHRRTSAGMFGASAGHHRVAIRTGGSCLDLATVEAPDTRRLQWTADARGAAGAVTPGVPAAGPEPAPGSTTTGYDSLRSLTRAAVDAVDAAGPDPDPGNVRLGIDSLVPLLGCRDESAAFRFLHATLGDVREANGIAHVHLPVARDHRSVRTVEPLFDATIELDVRDGDPRQRWHVADPPTVSGWLALDDTLPE